MFSTKVPGAEYEACLSTNATEASEESPPVYHGDVQAETNTNILPCACFVDLLAYSIPEATISDDQTTRYISVPLPTDDDHIKNLLKRQASLPPQPVVRIKGSHIDKLYSWGNTWTDFDLTLDVTPLITPTQHLNLPSQIIMAPNGVSGDEALDQCIERFSTGTEESLTLERVITNWNTTFLKSAIRDLVRSTKYQGDLNISFPVFHSRLVLSKECTVDGSSSTSSQKWFFRSTKSSKPVLCSLLPPSTCHIRTIWPYASSMEPMASSRGSTNSTLHMTTRSRPVVQSERAWFRTWQLPIRNGIIARQQCWITIEDMKDAVMGNIERPIPVKAWGTTSDDLATLMKGLKSGRSKRSSPRNFTRAMYLASGAVKR